jgi:hypothetical protein
MRDDAINFHVLVRFGISFGFRQSFSTTLDDAYGAAFNIGRLS